MPPGFTDKLWVRLARTKTFSIAFHVEKSGFAEDC